MASEASRPRKRAVFAEDFAQKWPQLRDEAPQRKKVTSTRALNSTNSPQRMSIVPQPSTSSINRTTSDASQANAIPIVRKIPEALSQGLQVRQTALRQGTRGVVRGVATPGKYAVTDLEFDNPENGASRSQQPSRSARKTIGSSQIARKSKTVHSDGQLPAGSAPIDDDAALARAIHALSVNTTPDTVVSARRLPFLRRNLRQALYDTVGGVLDSNRVIKLHKTFILNGRRYEGYYSFGWRCPLCRLKMQFATQTGLDHHLSHSHYQCEYRWRRATEGQITLEIVLPQTSQRQVRGRDDDESESSEEEPPSSPDTEEPEPEIAELPSTFSLAREGEVVEKKEYLEGPSVARAKTVAPSSPIKKQPSSPSLSAMNLEEVVVQRHEISEHFIHGRRETHVERPVRPIDPDDPERYPTPPPLRDLEGPSAVYPYVSHGAYSARPGGPRLYDILNELSLEEFGLLKWSVVEREEDLFELPDIRDEDKVMHALWNRWILLNRNEFLQNYSAGVKAFIDHYWPYIHRAAGHAALRVFFLVLGKHRFLTAGDVGDLLVHYRSLVGFDQWRKDSRQ